MKAYGTLAATGAAINIALGCIPRHVRVTNLTTGACLEWTDRMAAGAAAQAGGRVLYNDTGIKLALLTVATGIVPYLGGSALESSSSANVIEAALIQVAGTPVTFPYAGDMRTKGSTAVTAFTVDSVANRTGHFDQPVDTTYVGVGSRVWIGGLPFTIQAMTSTGAAANAVTLDRVPVAGAFGPNGYIVTKIKFPYDYYNGHVGFVMPSGITLNETANVNTSGTLLLEASAGETLLA